jgi:hypothetical protein
MIIYLTHARMKFNTKIAFENDFNSLFNEIWLSRLLWDLWFVEWDVNNVQPGMMFEIYAMDENGSEIDLCHFITSRDVFDADEINDLKSISGPHIVKNITDGLPFGWVVQNTICFEPILMNGGWKNMWTMIKYDKHCFIYCGSRTRYAVKIRSAG